MTALYLGYLASALVFATFWMKRAHRLRQVAIASNLCFIAYGAFAHLVPILVLHVALLPLNAVRLIEIERMMHRVRAALDGELSAGWLAGFTTRHRFAAGEFLFRKNDPAGPIYFIVEGEVELTEIGHRVRAGQLLGEMAIFSQHRARTLSACAVTPVTALSLSSESLLLLYQKNPQFAVYLVQLITKRLVADVQTLEAVIVDRTRERERFRELAAIDEHTGLPNARAFAARLRMEWTRATRGTAGPLSLIAVAGASVDASAEELRRTAEATVLCVSRSCDFVARRGDGVSALLPGTPLHAARRIAEEIAETLRAAGIDAVTGVASRLPQRDEQADVLVFEADEAILRERLARAASQALIG